VGPLLLIINIYSSRTYTHTHTSTEVRGLAEIA
jgi:hypothetical protein